MNAQKLSPRGYCHGVVNAISLAKKAALENTNQPVYIIGMIVHNEYITKALEALNITTLDDTKNSRLELIEKIDTGVVVLTAHGSEAQVKARALEKGLIVYDATCLDVLKTHNLIKDYLKNDYIIFYYGKENHPEAVAALSLDPEKIYLISSNEDLSKLSQFKDRKILFTNQTTLSYLDAQALFKAAASSFNKIELVNEICNATRVRQQALDKLDDDVQLAYVVGDVRSNNSNKLASIIKEHHNINVCLIDSVLGIDINDLKDISKVAVTSGASTPTYLTNQVIEYLEAFNNEDKSTHLKPTIDLDKVL